MIPKITFGIIILNGEPFTRYNLRALYPFAHEIIVVEGASPHAVHSASPDGHSLDGTLEVLRRFKAEEDPEQKITIVTAEDEGHPNGFWPGEKDEQSRAYARRATGNWLWQIDIDEFYLPEDFRRVIDLLATRRGLATISFPMYQFWGGLDYLSDGWYLRHTGVGEVHRLFRWGPGYRYAAHRPVTVQDEQGRDLREVGWLGAHDMARMGIFMYHYSMVFPFQARMKGSYYSSIFGRTETWAEHYFEQLKEPYRVHNVPSHPSWLERFRGVHPPEVLRMWDDIRAGRLGDIAIRPTADIDRLLESPRYTLGRVGLKLGGNVYYAVRGAALRVFYAMPTVVRGSIKGVVRRVMSQQAHS